MIQYNFEQFDEPIKCQSWHLRTLTKETGSVQPMKSFSAEIIMLDENFEQYSHRFFIDYDFNKTWDEAIALCVEGLKTFEV